MRVLNILLTLCVSLALFLGIFEGGLRLIGKGPKQRLVEFDNQLGWRKRANASVRKKTSEYDITIETNALGLRDDPMPSPAKPAGIFRVLVLGDSFVEGFSVARKDLFVDLLENWWRAEGRSVDVINAGTEAYSTDQEVAWLIQHGEEYRPDLVLLVPYDNDIYWNGEPRYIDHDSPKPLFQGDGSLASKTLVDPGPRPWAESWAVPLLFKRLWSKPADPRYFFVPPGSDTPILKELAPLLANPPAFLDTAVTGTSGALKAFALTCGKLGARALVAPVPSHSSIDPAYAPGFAKNVLLSPKIAWQPDQPLELMLALCTQSKLETLDARAALRAEASAGSKLYYDVDWHLNALGNRAFARFLHGEFERIGAFPAAFPATKTAELAPLEIEAGLPAWTQLFALLLVLLSTAYALTYKDEPAWEAPFKVGALLAVVFTLAIGGGKLLTLLPPLYARAVALLVVAGILGFVCFKLGRRLGTIVELLLAFTRRGHWYLMPLVVVLLSVGSLLVVAASSPLIAPLIYTLF